MNATNVMFRVTIPTCRQNAFPATRQITMPLPIPTTPQQELTTFAWSVTPPYPDGNLPNSPYMTHSFSPYTQERMTMNGTIAPTVTAIPPTIPFLHASIAMNITVQTWMTNIRMKMIMNIPVWRAWTAIQQVVKTKYLR